MREQARIAAILGHPSAAHNLPLAVSLACETRMTRREAIAVMRGQASNDDGDDDYVPRNRHARDRIAQSAHQRTTDQRKAGCQLRAGTMLSEGDIKTR
jgi:hypothetical protein